jgi:hypothetical protein
VNVFEKSKNKNSSASERSENKLSSNSGFTSKSSHERLHGGIVAEGNCKLLKERPSRRSANDNSNS